ncbi:anti-sigma factor [Pseudomonas sp. SLFW]|uniref:anti-sigma factor family protein n=1 Tax=Pseudomonas sp. SLFW TaxID=2683259 RepID=UPI001413302C|nr:transcriptional regulator [Pseudomonas sp. SLFW]NBB09502.1 transcriptional regulator [Pseudomonas sp. SLFW]
MTHDTTHAPPSDEWLVAWLDDELDREQRQSIDDLLRTDASVAARFERLKRSDLPFREAFDSVLDDAPTARLQHMLDGLPAAAAPPKPALSRRGFLAMAATFVVAGIAADRLFMGVQSPKSGGGWRGSVAEYMALYTPQTLDNLTADRSSHVSQLSSVGQQLGLALNPEMVALPGAEFRRAQILDYDGVLIGQLTYLDARHGPLALCINQARTGSETLGREQRLGLNVVYWSNTRQDFMLVGKNPFEDLEIMARSVQKRLPV